MLFLTVNIALNKPAYQKRPWTADKRYDASNAVDGRKSNRSWRGGECSKTYGEQNATWWVNLTSIHRIHHIIIYYMKSYGHWGNKTYIFNGESHCDSKEKFDFLITTTETSRM